jgi:phage terminase large subunit-like protein
MQKSLQQSVDCLTPAERARLRKLAQVARYRWTLHARPAQQTPPGEWLVWLILAGRGFGKTRTGAEETRRVATRGITSHIALVGDTPADVRDVMIEGESGILAVSPKSERPQWNPSIRRLTWPNGVKATTYSSWNFDELRGPQHGYAWCDELCKWKYPRETWDMLMLGLRLGALPRAVVTTTPKAIPVLREIMASPGTVVTRGTTYDNLSNLAPAFRERVLQRYEGTRLGRQELNAEILEDAEGALWSREWIEAGRVSIVPALRRVAVAVDPAATSTETADEAGIVGAAVGQDGDLYVLDDRTLRTTPLGWAQEAVALYHKLKADRLVGEVNNGGEMVELTIRTVDRNVAYRAVHASRGKQTRAEPVAALYEQGRAHHVGTFPDLEDEMCQWVPGQGASPNRVDALVWAATDLLFAPAGPVQRTVALADRVRVSPY